MTQIFSGSDAYLKAKIVFEGSLICLTGLHIGGVETGIDVGDINKNVIRNPYNNEPYIPGSSIKGKIRSLLEYAKAREKTLEDAKGIADVVDVVEIKKLFGTAISKEKSEGATDTEKQGVPSKVLFRDATLSAADKNLPETFFNGLKYTERKAENTLRRLTASATPRQIERVPAGTKFDFSMVVNVVQENVAKIDKDLELLYLGFELLKYDGLGGMISRGYGQVDIKWNKIEIYIIEGNSLKPVDFKGTDFPALINHLAG